MDWPPFLYLSHARSPRGGPDLRLSSDTDSAAFVRYYLRGTEHRRTEAAAPALGFVVCLFIWLNLRWQAKLAGGAWMLFGILYGAWKTRGFRADLVRFESSPDAG